MKSPVSQRLLATAALLLLPTLGACGFGAQTDQVYQAAVGPNDRSTDVNVLNAVIVSDTDGTGTFAGSLVNTTDADIQLTSVTGDGVTADTATGQAITVPAFGLENLGAPGETVPPAKLTVSGDADAITPGTYVTLTFSFSAGRSVTMRVPVVPVTADYESVPLPQPKKSPKADATDTPAGDDTDAE